MSPGDFATLPHPFKDSGNKAQTGRGKEPPSLRSGGPSLSAIRLGEAPGGGATERNVRTNHLVNRKDGCGVSV